MNRLRNRLILAFLAATAVPLLMTGWVSLRLLHYSLSFNATEELDQVSRSLQKTGHELYQRACQSLKQGAETGRTAQRQFGLDTRGQWPAVVEDFWRNGETERFALSGDRGDRLDYLVRQDAGIRMYSEPLHVPMDQLTSEYKQARALVQTTQSRDLRRGFTLVFVLLSAAIWVFALIAVFYWAARI